MTNLLLQDLAEVMRLRAEWSSSNSDKFWKRFSLNCVNFIGKHHASIEQNARDAERLEWLWEWLRLTDKLHLTPASYNGSDMREAIDAAMAQEKPHE